MRRPRSTSRPWAAATARSEGIGARSPPARGVGETEHRRTRLGKRHAQVGDALHGGGEALLRREGGVDLVRLEGLEPVGRDEERRQDDEVRQRPLGVERRPCADERRDRHHGPLAVMVDRRVRHLREALAEVRREGPCAAGEGRDRRVVAHRVDGVLAGLRDRSQHQAELLARVPVERMSDGEVLGGRRERLALGAEVDARLDPRRVRLAPSELALELSVEEQPAIGVDREELARPESCAPHDGALGERDRARLRRDRDEAVVAHRDAQRAQPVPVEGRAAHDAVAVDEAGGTVPRLGEHRVVAVHRPLRVPDARIVLPGGRNEQRDRLPHVEPGTDEQLERVVEERGVRAGAIERRCQLGLEAAGALARLHPGDVPLDRVDLAVVTEEPERLCALPARLGVRGEALVEDRPGGRPPRVGEVRVEALQLGRCAERLVGHRTERDGGDVDAVDPLRPASRTVCAQLGVRLGARSEHELRDARHARRRGRAERRDVVRDVAPAERLEPLRAACLLDDPAEPRLAEEAHGDAGAVLARQGLVQRQEQACAVTRHPVRCPRAPVRDGGEPGERTIDDLARGPALGVGNQPDAAGIAFGARIVEWGCHVGRSAFRGRVVGGASRGVWAASWRGREGFAG